ncbi:T9SS type A sorting domain-containing protein [Bacteroidales bacterium OttesenSCG-928-M11]|nr:T9SS type A sorting domain-containing protein [Bacteroidales bacterium OttesenSCG-928-M11]
MGNKLLFKAMAVIVCLLLQFNLQAKTIHYVKADGTGNGTSWDNASGSIQNMIAKAEAGDEVWVAKGTYYPTLELEARDERSKTFLLKDGVSLYGGFSGNETNIDSRKKSDLDENGTIEAWEFTNETILSGNIDGVEDVWTKTEGSNYWYWKISGNSGNCYRVVTCNEEFSSLTFFDGFTVMGGSNSKDKESGGLKAEGEIIITNCTIKENYSSYHYSSGGGIYNNGGTITNCSVSGNYSYSFWDSYGGGIYNNGGTITNCMIRENYSYSTTNDSYGGGIYNNEGTITDCTISGNCSSSFSYNFPYSYGGGIYNNGGTVTDCTVNGNFSYAYYSSSYTYSYSYGGGICNIEGTVTNCIINENSSYAYALGNNNASYGGGLYNGKGGITTNCIVSGNYNNSFGNGVYNKGGIIATCLVMGDLYVISSGPSMDIGYVYFCTVVDGSISGRSYNCIADYSELNEDYTLKEGSSYINSGNITDIPEDILNGIDMAGNPRVLLGKPDAGIYEYIMPTVTLPFVETFSYCTDFYGSYYMYGSPTINGGNTMKWKIDNQKAVFDYNAVTANKEYSEIFFSYLLDGKEKSSVLLKYDMNFEAYGGITTATSIEQLSVEYSLDLETWEEIANYTNANGDIANKTYQHDISNKVAGKEFYIRFRAHGQNVSVIEKWEIDNIIVKSAGDSDPTRINTINNENISIQSISNGIAFEAKEQIPVSIFNISGQKVYESVINGYEEIYLNKGVYIVRVNNESQKIIVR